MSTVAERIAALNAKKKAEPAPPAVQRTGAKWQKPNNVETKSPEAGPTTALSPQGLKATPSWIKPTSGSVNAPLPRPVSNVQKTSPQPSPQSSPPPTESPIGSSPSIKIPVLTSTSEATVYVAGATVDVATATTALQEEKTNHIGPKVEPKTVPIPIERKPQEVRAKTNELKPMEVAEAKAEPLESKQQEKAEPAVQDNAADLAPRPPLPTSRKPSLVDPSTSAQADTPSSVTTVPANQENMNIQSGLEPQKAKVIEVESTRSAESAITAAPVIPPSRRPSAPSEEGVPIESLRGPLPAQIEITPSIPEPGLEKASVQAVELEKPVLTSSGSRRTIRFAEAPVIVEYREHQIELGIDGSQTDKVEAVLPPSSPLGNSKAEVDEDEEGSLVDTRSEDDDDEEFSVDEHENETYELRDDDDDGKKESKSDPPKPLQSGLRPSLLREGSSERGSRRSVRFGVGDEVKVEEYNYEDLDRQASQDEPPSPIPPPPPLPVDEAPASEPRRRSSLGERVASVFKRATGSSSSTKDQKKVINGLSWG